MNKLNQIVSIIIGILLISQTAMGSIEMLTPLPSQSQVGFIKFEAKFDEANTLFFLLDNSLLSDSECTTSPCEYYYDSYLLPNGEHVIGAITLNNDKTQRVDSLNYTISINNPIVPNMTASENQDIEVKLILIDKEMSSYNPLNAWLYVHAPSNDVLTPFFNLDIKLHGSDGIVFSPEMPNSWKISFSDTYFTYIEIENISEGMNTLSVKVEGHKIIDQSNGVDVSDVMIDSSFSIISTQGTVRIE